MGNQRGLSLIGLILIGILIAMAAVLAMKIGPAYLEYYTILKNVNAIVNSPDSRGTVADIRKSYDRRATVDDTSAIRGADLEIAKSGGEVVISFSYAKKVPLVGNVSACMDFDGSTRPSRMKDVP